MKKLIPLLILVLSSCTSAPLTKTFYISPSGNDHARGTSARPWASLEGAAPKVQQYMDAHPGTDVELILKGGEYILRDSVEFKGLNGLTIKGAEGEDVILSGERQVFWKKLTEPYALGKIRTEVAPKVLEADLKELDIEDAGEVSTIEDRMDLYFNGKRQTLARWPDTGFTKAGLALGQTVLGDTWIHIHGTEEGILEYLDEEIEKWTDEQDPQMFGYWYWDWADSYRRLSSLDKEKKIMTLSEPWGGYGFRDSCRFYGTNLLCELDSPGEYYIDRERMKLYWYAPEGIDAGTDGNVVSVFSRDYVIAVKDCQDFHLESISFKGCRNGAVSISGGSSNVIRDCRFSRFGQTVIRIEEGIGHRVEGCLMEELGCGGIWMKGGNRKKLVSSEFEVTNTIVDNFSLFKRTYQPAIYFHGVGLYVAHNLFQNSSSSAMRLEGNDITVEYNQLFDLVNESDDQGGIDSFFNYSYRRINLKYNHWKNIKGGMFAGAAAIRFDDIVSGHLVYGNVFENCGGALFGGVQINNGRDNNISNNVFFKCPVAVSGQAGQGEGWTHLMNQDREHIDEVDALSELYECRYPELKAHYRTTEGYNYVQDNVVVGASSLLRMPETFKTSNNWMFPLDDNALQYYLDDAFLKEHGLVPIDFKSMGLESNRYWK